MSVSDEAVEAALEAFMTAKGTLRDHLNAILEAAAPHMRSTVDASAVVAELRMFNHHKAADMLESLTEGKP